MKRLLEAMLLLSIEIYSNCASVETSGTQKMEILQYSIRHQLLKMMLHIYKTTKHKIACKPNHNCHGT